MSCHPLVLIVSCSTSSKRSFTKGRRHTQLTREHNHARLTSGRKHAQLTAGHRHVQLTKWRNTRNTPGDVNPRNRPLDVATRSSKEAHHVKGVHTTNSAGNVNARTAREAQSWQIICDPFCNAVSVAKIRIKLFELQRWLHVAVGL